MRRPSCATGEVVRENESMQSFSGLGFRGRSWMDPEGRRVLEDLFRNVHILGNFRCTVVCNVYLHIKSHVVDASMFFMFYS